MGIKVRIVNPVDDDEDTAPEIPLLLRIVVEIGFGTGPRTDNGEEDNDDAAPDEEMDAIGDGPVVVVTMAADAAAYVVGAGTFAVVLVVTLRFLYLVGAGAAAAAATSGRAAVPLASVMAFRFFILVVPGFLFGGLLSLWVVWSGFFFFFFFFNGVRRTCSSCCGGGGGAGPGRRWAAAASHSRLAVSVLVAIWARRASSNPPIVVVISSETSDSTEKASSPITAGTTATCDKTHGSKSPSTLVKSCTQ